MKHRLQRVRELIKRELGDILSREIQFEQLVTIQEVDITPDLKQAHIYVSVLGDDPGAPKKVLAKLLEKRKDLQHLLSRRVILKYTPVLNFKLDTAIERGTRVISILEDLDLPEPEEEPEEELEGVDLDLEDFDNRQQTSDEPSDEEADTEPDDDGNTDDDPR